MSVCTKLFLSLNVDSDLKKKRKWQNADSDCLIRARECCLVNWGKDQLKLFHTLALISMARAWPELALLVPKIFPKVPVTSNF